MPMPVPSSRRCGLRMTRRWLVPLPGVRRPGLRVEVLRADVDVVQILRIDGIRPGDVLCEHSLLDKSTKVLIEGVHAHRRSCLHGGVQLRDLTLADHVRDGRSVDQYLGRDGSTALLSERQQRLADDPLQRVAQLSADLLLLVRRKHIDDAVDALRRSLRVQSGKDEVTGLRSRQRGLNRLRIAKLADQDDVGVLSQDPPQRFCEGAGVAADLALVDQRALALVVELDRVFDGDDVRGDQFVHDVDHRREGRRLARSGRAGEQHQAAGKHREIPRDGRCPEFFERIHAVGDEAQSDRDRPELPVDVRAKTSDSLRRVREVDFAALIELLALACAHQTEGDVLHPRLGELLRELGNRHEVAVDPHERRSTCGDVDVGRTGARALGQQLVQASVCHDVILLRRRR